MWKKKKKNNFQKVIQHTINQHMKKNNVHNQKKKLKKKSMQAKKINDKIFFKKSEKIANKINYDLKFI